MIHPFQTRTTICAGKATPSSTAGASGTAFSLTSLKGRRRRSEAGFNFGTCHPFFPLSPEGSLHNVLELPTPSQDLCVFAPKLLLEPLMEAALQHHGILHLLFHPAHIFKPGVAEALIEAVTSGRGSGMEWWTAAEINRWEQNSPDCALARLSGNR